MDLFLDANVYLSFYHFSADDIETMHKVVKLINDEEITLYINDHLRHEISRNRHGKLKDGLKQFEQRTYGGSIPNYCKPYPEFEKIRTHAKETVKLHKTLMEKIHNDIKTNNLASDGLLEKIFEAATPIELTEDLLTKARERVRLGNPPGKANSLGDAIHWECLLSSNSSNLHFVSMDKDFSSPLYPSDMNTFLVEEWMISNEKRYAPSIEKYETITSFLKEKFPKFELSIEVQKDDFIAQLQLSSSFAETHEIVGELLQLGSFTRAQSGRLCNILISNYQVGWIAKDDDLQSLFKVVKDNAWYAIDFETASACEKELDWKSGELGLPF